MLGQRGATNTRPEWAVGCGDIKGMMSTTSDYKSEASRRVHEAGQGSFVALAN